MQSFGGRSIAALMIIFLVYLAINLTEGVVMFAFFGEDFLYGYDVFMKENILATAVSGVFCLIWLLVMSPLFLGHTKLNLSFAEGKDESINLLFDMFSKAKRFFGSAFFALSFAIRYVFVFAIALAPGAAMFYCAETFIPEAGRAVEMLKISVCCLSVGIMILCAAMAAVFVQRWHLAPYYFAEGTGIAKSFSVSAKATKGIRANILAFKFSFAGWLPLSILILPMLWSIPFYLLSNAIYAKYLMERYERSLAEIPETE